MNLEKEKLLRYISTSLIPMLWKDGLIVIIAVSVNNCFSRKHIIKLTLTSSPKPYPTLSPSVSKALRKIIIYKEG